MIQKITRSKHPKTNSNHAPTTNKKSLLSNALILCLFLSSFSWLIFVFHHAHYHQTPGSTRAYDLNLKPTSSASFLSVQFDFHPSWHPSKRSKRFPSREERIKLYMSNWYLPPCHPTASSSLGGGNGNIQNDERIGYSYGSPQQQQPYDNNTFEISFGSRQLDDELFGVLDTNVQSNVPFVLQEKSLHSCIQEQRITKNNQQRQQPSDSINHEKIIGYCEDALHIMHIMNETTADISSFDHDYTSKKNNKLIKATMIKDYDGTLHAMPVIVQFIRATISSSSPSSPFYSNDIEIPFFQEYRFSASNSKEISSLTHGGDLDCSIPGLRKPLKTLTISSPSSPSNHGDKHGYSYVQLLYAPIIWFLNSQEQIKLLTQIPSLDIPWSWKKNEAVMLDIQSNDGSSQQYDKSFFSSKRFKRENQIMVEFNKMDTKSSSMNNSTNIRMKNMLQCKAIILPSSNSISLLSDLKWSMYSKSIVLMPQPKITSFAMEELLQPYVHYIPLKDDLSNIEDQLLWIQKNDHKAQMIAERGTLFMFDLFFHKDAKLDNLVIQMVILKRYLNFFVNENL